MPTYGQPAPPGQERSKDYWLERGFGEGDWPGRGFAARISRWLGFRQPVTGPQVHSDLAPSLTDAPLEEHISVGLLGSQVTRGAGVVTYIDDLGEVETIPQTQSSFAASIPFPEDPDAPEIAGTAGIAVYPDTPINYEADEQRLHDQIENPVPALVRKPNVVNPNNPGIPNLGPVNDQPYYTAKSQIVLHYQGEEQGELLDPAIAQSRFPHVENSNPWYGGIVKGGAGIWRRNGQLNFSSEGIPFGFVTAQRIEEIEEARRNRGTVQARLVDQPPMTSFSDTVPVEGQAGPLNIQELYNDVDAEAEMGFGSIGAGA